MIGQCKWKEPVLFLLFIGRLRSTLCDACWLAHPRTVLHAGGRLAVAVPVRQIQKGDWETHLVVWTGATTLNNYVEAIFRTIKDIMLSRLKA